MCEYAYYDDKETFRQKLYCSLQKGKPCIYTRFCVRTNKFVPSNNMESCFMVLEKKKRDIPVGSNYVRFTRKGYLYVEVDGKVIKVRDAVGNVDNYVFLRTTDRGYEVSLNPFVEETESIVDIEVNSEIIDNVKEDIEIITENEDIVEDIAPEVEMKDVDVEETENVEEDIKPKKKRGYNKKKKSND